MTTTPDARGRRRLRRLILAATLVVVLLGGWLTYRFVDASLNTSELRIDRFAVRDDGRTLDVTYPSSTCSKPVATRVEESATSVDISVVQRRTGHDTCNAMVSDQTLTVRLDRPLGDRRVLSRGERVSG